MPNDPERYLTLRQADQARTDFAIIEDELEAIYARVARLPSRGELWRVCLVGMEAPGSPRPWVSLPFPALMQGGEWQNSPPAWFSKPPSWLRSPAC